MAQQPGNGDQQHSHLFDAHELAIVLSHYDLGVIEEIRDFPRGSRRAPKLRLKTRKGDFLLKRRAPGRDDPYRVAFAHALQLHLAQRGYPVPGMVGTRDENNSMLQIGGRTYELFRFVSGTKFDHSETATVAAGAALAMLHRLLSDHRPQFDSPVGSFHTAPWLEPRFAQIPAAVAAVEPQADIAALTQTAGFLKQAYQQAGRRVEELGFSAWQRIIIHGDWHPGNLLYREGKVVAVLDFDSARIEPRMADVANAALQFSMRFKAEDDPAAWPGDLDMAGFRSLLRGYHDVLPKVVSRPEMEALPWLIIEALIVESVVPIATTGSFARVRGSSFLQMVERKVRWIDGRASRPGGFLEE